MTTIRITLPNNIVIDTDITSAMAIIDRFNPQVAKERVEQVKANNALIAPKLTLEAKKLQAKINQNNLYNSQVIEYNPLELLTAQQRKILSASFHYAPSKDKSKGRAAYVAAILMDFQIHTIKEIATLSGANLSTIGFAIDRLREIGSQIDTTSERLGSKTMVQLNVLVKPNPRRIYAKAHSVKPAVKTQASTSDGFNNLTV